MRYGYVITQRINQGRDFSVRGSHNQEKHDFPRKEKVDTNANGCIPTDWKTILTKEHIEDAGKV